MEQCQVSEQADTSDRDPALLYRGQHLSVYEQNGWEYVARNTARGAVGVVAVTDAGDVVLVEQYRPPARRSVVELPAGLSGDIAGNEDEALLEAAQRELLEETGYAAARWTELVTGYSSPGLTNESITLFLAEGLTREGPGGGDHTEDITIHELPPGDVLPWLAERGLTADLKLLAGLFAASEHRRSNSR